WRRWHSAGDRPAPGAAVAGTDLSRSALEPRPGALAGFGVGGNWARSRPAITIWGAGYGRRPDPGQIKEAFPSSNNRRIAKPVWLVGDSDHESAAKLFGLWGSPLPSPAFMRSMVRKHPVDPPMADASLPPDDGRRPARERRGAGLLSPVRSPADPEPSFIC